MSNHPPALTDTDVLVIGAGPAGSVTAGLLAKEGHRVTVLERNHFPRYHIGESMITGMIPVLDELGLRDRIDAYDFPVKHGITLVWGDDPEPWSTKFTQAGPFEHSWHVRRDEFDAILADRARELGATVVHGAHAVAPLFDGGGTVTGVAWRDESGEDHETRARYTVDASGQARVLVRKLTGVHRQEDLNSVAVWSYYSPYDTLPGDERSHILVESVPDGWFWAIPVSESKLSVGLVIKTDAFVAQSKTESKEQIFDEHLAHTRVARGMVEKGSRELEMRTTRDWSYNSETFFGPGWVAVGDSAVFVDPLFSSGAWLATSGGWLAARALHASLESGSSNVERGALEKFDRIYRQIALDIFAYVRYFNDPTRSKEDYQGKAASIAKVVSEQSELGFISLISGISALPEVLNFDPIGWDNVAETAKKAGLPGASENGQEAP